jgi:hypothetical protein
VGRIFPTAEMNSEMRIPHGSDWSSIRVCGDKTEHYRNPTGKLSGAGSYGQRKRMYVDPSLDLPSQRGLVACPKWERLGAGSSRTDQYSFPRNPAESTVLRLRKTNLRNEVTTHSLSAHNDRAGANRMRWAGGIVQEANAWGNAQDMLTWTQQLGR